MRANRERNKIEEAGHGTELRSHLERVGVGLGRCSTGASRKMFLLPKIFTQGTKTRENDLTYPLPSADLAAWAGFESHGLNPNLVRVSEHGAGSPMRGPPFFDPGAVNFD